MAKLALVLCVVVAVLSLALQSDALCGTVVNGKTVDLSMLTARNGSYQFSSKYNGTTWDFELQVCENVKSKFSACTVPSPVNQIDTSTGACFNAGDLTTTAWDENPSQNGIYVTYYHGKNVNTVIHRSARIYFECNSTIGAGAPVFEHVTDCGQYHFSWTTSYVCFK